MFGVNILLADDHNMVREGISLLLKQFDRNCEIYECLTYQDMEQIVHKFEFDFMLVDLVMPGMNGMQGVRSIRRTKPSTPIIILSSTEESSTIQQAINCGVNGYVTKSLCSDELIQAIKAVLVGEIYIPPAYFANGKASVQSAPAEKPSYVDIPVEYLSLLTVRQREVMELLSMGISNKEIANKLNMSEPTVRTHLTAIFRKLGVGNRTQAVRKFMGYLQN